MKPENYSNEILSQEYALVLYEYFDDELYRSKVNVWGIPPVFTLQEARDGFLPGEQNQHLAGMKLTVEECERLRKIKPGKIGQMSFDVGKSNNWWALRLDNNSVETELRSKEKMLAYVRAKTQEVASDLLKQEQTLKAEVDALREKQLRR